MFFFFQQVFRACLEAEKQRELSLLALRRTVSCNKKCLEVHKQKASQSICSESTLTHSMSSIKVDVSVHDSGLEMNDEMQGLKDKNRELKLKNAILQSELLAVEKTNETEKARIEKREEGLQVSRQKWEMFEDHSSLMALHAREVSESKELLICVLEMREKQLDAMKKENTEMMLKMEEKHAKEMTHNAIQMKELKEAASELEGEKAEFRKKLQDRDLDSQAKDMVSTVMCNSLHENFKEDLGEYVKKNKCLEDQLAMLQIKIVDEDSKIAESISQLEELKDKCKMHENKESLLTLQLGKANNALEILNSELALKQREIEAMEMKNTEMRKLADENEEKVLQELLKNELLEQEIARSRTTHVQLEEKLKEQEVLLTSKQTTFNAILRGMATTFEQEAAKHQEQIQEMQIKINEGEDCYISLLDKASLLDLKLLRTKNELIDLKDKYYTKGQELKRENSQALAKVLSKQAESVQTLNGLTSKLKSFMEKCRKLEEANEEFEANSGLLQLEVDSREEKIKQLHEQLTICDERLHSKEIAIEQLSIKRPKRHGLRRLLCC